MNTRIAAATLVVLALAVGGFTYYFFHRNLPAPAPTSGGTVSLNPQSGGSAVSPPRTTPQGTVIYTVVASGGDENNLAPQPFDLGSTKTPARAVMDALIQSPQSPLPTGTRLLDIRINDGLATINLSKEFKSNFQGGDLQEAQAVNSVLMTLGQFSTIDRVQFLVEGAPIDTLGGHFELNAPVDVLRPNSVQQAKADQGGQ